MNIPSKQVPDQIKALQEKFPEWDFILLGRKKVVETKDDITIQSTMDVAQTVRVIAEVNMSGVASVLNVMETILTIKAQAEKAE